MTRHEMEATREKWRNARTADFFAQYTPGDKDSVQKRITASSEQEAKRPEPKL
jgi:hypothetical protein